MRLYKGFKTQFAPLLTAVFTAVGRLKKVPKKYLVIRRGINRQQLDNYRPFISLTTTDYRLLGKKFSGASGVDFEQGD